MRTTALPAAPPAPTCLAEEPPRGRLVGAPRLRLRRLGTPAGGDLFSKLVGQAIILLRERQFDEAAHVFSALLAADPSAVQVKQLFREAETKQIESLYQDLPPSAVVVPLESGTGDRNRLTASDCQVLDRVNGRWDVSVLVLASPLREVETLKSLRKLLNLRFIKLRVPKRVARSRSQR